MLKRITLASICCFLTLQLFAQKQTSDSAATRHKWEVGTDLLWLIDKHNLPATTVFIRRHLERPNRMPSAIRMRAGFGINGIDDRPGKIERVVDYHEGFNPYLRAGYEWQVPKGKLQLYYGADVQVAYWKKDSRDLKIYWVDTNFPEGEFREILTLSNEYQWDTGVVGFAGAKYFLTPQITLSVEASYELTRSMYDSKYRIYFSEMDKAGDDYFSGGSWKTTKWNGRFYPISVVNLSFHF